MRCNLKVFQITIYFVHGCKNHLQYKISQFFFLLGAAWPSKRCSHYVTCGGRLTEVSVTVSTDIILSIFSEKQTSEVSRSAIVVDEEILLIVLQ